MPIEMHEKVHAWCEQGDSTQRVIKYENPKKKVNMLSSK